jgi:hypothetical protein
VNHFVSRLPWLTVDMARPALWDCLSGLHFAEVVLSSGDRALTQIGQQTISLMILRQFNHSKCIYLSSYLSIYLSIYLWLYSPLLDLGRFFSFYHSK